MASGEAIILGSGTSNGVPMLGVHYTPEFLANPKNHRTRSSCLLQSPDGNFLIDCTPEMRIQLVRENIFSVQEVLITHTHADHVMGMDDLRSFCITEERAIPVYTLPRYQDDIRRIFPYAFVDHPSGLWVPRFDLRDAPPMLETCGLNIHIFEVLHGKVPCLGIRVNDFAYLTDVNFIPDAVIAKLQDLDTLVIDAVRHEPHPNHFHFAAAMTVIEKLAPKKAFLTHLSHEYDHNTFEENLPSHVRLAFDGLQIPF
ncbi:MAG: MBL fold metallo-hydrolase [Armatimonadetes bacterium]|nr:MBL fold metallo-hydrolase [Armatimonadota bacterium]